MDDESTRTTIEGPQATDVAVIGGGLAGLVASITAAKAGADVSLIDARSLGGRARTAERDGFLLNEGAHALYRGGGGWAVLESLGVHPQGVTPPAANYRTLWDGEIARLPVGTTSILASRLLGTRSKMKLGGWFADIAGTAAKVPDISLGDFLDGEGARPDLVKYVTTMGRLVSYAARPEDLPARAILTQFALPGGVAYLHGGWQSVIDALSDQALQFGVTIIEGEPVTGLVDENAWTVTTSGRTIAANAVVIAAGGPALATNLLGEDPANWVERAGPVQRAACLDVGGRQGDIDFLQSADGPLYLSLHAPVAELAPEGQRLVTLMRYLAADDDTSAHDNRAALERHAALAGLAPTGERALERFLAAPVVTWGSPQVGIERPTGLELADRGIFAAGDWIGRPLLADAAIVSGAATGIAAARRASVSV